MVFMVKKCLNVGMDITIFRNRSYPITYNHVDSNGDPVSLVGATVYFTVKEEAWDTDATDTDALIKKTITTHSNPAEGETTFTLDDADTNIDAGKYNYDVVVEFDGLSEPPSLYGRFTVVGTPTNRNVGNE